MLLMALPNEHLMTFNRYKDAKSLFAPIEIRFGGNEATKKTQKTLLKQMYKNFSTTSIKSLDFIFNRLQKIVSQLAVLSVFSSQEDLNLKILRSLPSKWNTHVVVCRNKTDLDTMSIDDLYNNFKIVEQEVEGTARSNSSSQNMDFVSSPSTNTTNEVHTYYGVSTASTQPSTASTQVNTASSQTSTANLSDATVYAFLANQSNGSQLVHEELKQIHEDDLEEMDLKWQGPRNQDSRNRYQDSSRRTVNVEETLPKAMVAIDGVGFDWSFMADDEVPTNMGLMAFSDSELDLSNSGLEEFQQPEFEGYGPKTGKSVSEDILDELKEYVDASLVKDMVSDNKDFSVESPVVVEKKTDVLTITKVEVKTVNREEQTQALVDKKKVIIIETSVRSDLHLEDAEVESFEDAGLDNQEDASKQERMIKDLDANERVALVDETQGRNDQDMFDKSILNDEEVVAEKEVSATDPVPTIGEVVLTAGEVVTTVGVEAKDKGKAKTIKPKKSLKKKDQIIIDEEVSRNLEAHMQVELEEEKRLARQKEDKVNIALIESWDNTQAMMDADYELAARLQEEERG
nr:ribonuclease H-like domain-containing protein [Tanacetum cinerariifolium]